MYYIYILRCHDGSLYTGITTNLKRRYQEHLSQGNKAAKYTKTHHVQSLERYWTCQNRKQASKLEYQIKQLTKIQKENIIKKDNDFALYLKDKVILEDYKRGDIL